MTYIIVRKGSTDVIVTSASKRQPMEYASKAKADRVCDRMNGSLDPPGSPKPEPPYEVIERPEQSER